MNYQKEKLTIRRAFEMVEDCLEHNTGHGNKEFVEALEELGGVAHNLYSLSIWPKKAVFGLQVLVEDLQTAIIRLCQQWVESQPDTKTIHLPKPDEWEEMDLKEAFEVIENCCSWYMGYGPKAVSTIKSALKEHVELMNEFMIEMYDGRQPSAITFNKYAGKITKSLNRFRAYITQQR